MQWAELVLEYVEALAWPVVVGGALFAFRVQIASKIKDLTGVRTAIGEAKFDREAKELEEKVDRAAARQEDRLPVAGPQPGPEPGGPEPGGPEPGGPEPGGPEPGGPEPSGPEPSGPEPSGPEPSGPEPSGPEPGPSEPSDHEDDPLSDEELTAAFEQDLAAREAWDSDFRTFQAVSRAREQLTTPPDFGTARDVATSSPNAAVMLAYAEVEKVARAAWTVAHMESSTPRTGMTTLVREVIPDAEFTQITRELSELRNRVAHGAGDVSTTGAFDFIAACERSSEVLVDNSLSRLRHPSRSQVLRRWADSFAYPDAERLGRPVLTAREVEVLNELARGAPISEIAAELVVSQNTVRTHVFSLYRKLGVNRRSDALVAARNLHLL